MRKIAKKNIKKNIVGLKELREHMETYITRMNKGESFTVVRRAQPVFHISPVDVNDDELGWETVIDFTDIQKGGVSAREVLRSLRTLNGKA